MKILTVYMVIVVLLFGMAIVGAIFLDAMKYMGESMANEGTPCQVGSGQVRLILPEGWYIKEFNSLDGELGFTVSFDTTAEQN